MNVQVAIAAMGSVVRDNRPRGSARNSAPGFFCRGHRGHLDGELPWGHMAPGFQIPLNRMAHIDPVTGITLSSIITKFVIVNTAGRQVPS